MGDTDRPIIWAHRSTTPEQFCNAINELLHHLAVLPHIHRPTRRAAKKRTAKLLEQARPAMRRRILQQCVLIP